MKCNKYINEILVKNDFDVTFKNISLTYFENLSLQWQYLYKLPFFFFFKYFRTTTSFSDINWMSVTYYFIINVFEQVHQIITTWLVLADSINETNDQGKSSLRLLTS